MIPASRHSSSRPGGIEPSSGAACLVAAGLMTDAPPCSCGAGAISQTCVHHSPAWLRIRRAASPLPPPHVNAVLGAAAEVLRQTATTRTGRTS